MSSDWVHHTPLIGHLVNRSYNSTFIFRGGYWQFHNVYAPMIWHG